MNEHSVAIGSPRSYPISRGNIMAEPAVREETSSQTPSAQNEEVERNLQDRERERGRKARAEQTRRKEIEKKAEKFKQIKLTFAQQKKIADVVSRVQAEKQAAVFPRQLAEFKALLAKTKAYGRIHLLRMKPQEIVAETQLLLRYAQRETLTPSDLPELSRVPLKNREVKRKLIEKEVEKAASLDEEELTPDKIKEHLQIAGIEEAGTELPTALDEVKWVEADEHLEEITDRERAEEILRQHGIKDELPKKWEEMTPLQRVEWQEEHSIFSHATNREEDEIFYTAPEIDLAKLSAAVGDVKSEAPLETLLREEVAEKLRVAEVGAQIPEEWNDMDVARRLDILAGTGIVNEVEPPIETVKIGEKEYRVWEDKTGRKVIFGFQTLSKKEVEAVFKKLGVKVKLPRDWDNPAVIRPDGTRIKGRKKIGEAGRGVWMDEKQLWLEAKGVQTILASKDKGDYSLLEPRSLGLTSGQVKELYGFDPGRDWYLLSASDRAKVFMSHGYIQSVGGGAFEHPEWNDVVGEKNPLDPIDPVTNPATLNPGANVRIPLAEIIKRRLRLVTEGRAISGPVPAGALPHDWDELHTAMLAQTARMTAADYKNFGDIMGNWEEMNKLVRWVSASGEPHNEMILDWILPQTIRLDIQTKITALDAEITARVAALPPQARMALFNDLKDKSVDLLNSLKSGWYSEEYIRDELLKKARESTLNTFPGYEGIREWFVWQREFPNVQAIMEEFRELKAVTDPAEMETVVRRGLMKVMATALNAQDVQNYYQRILSLLQDYPRFQSKEFLEQANRLYGMVNAHLMVTKEYLTSQGDQGDPAKELQVYQEINDYLAERGINTWELLLKSFRMTYTDGRAIEGDDKLPILDAAGNEYDFNLLSDALNVYYFWLAQEKLMFNEIVRFQREGGALNAAVFAACGVPPPAVFSRDGLEAWARRNTFLQANNEPRILPDGTPGTNFEYQNLMMKERIKDFLQDFRGIDPAILNRVPGVKGRMERLLDSVNLAAFRWVRVKGLSEYDGLQVYGADRHRQSVLYGDHTPFFCREIDNIWWHNSNEERGRAREVNDIMEEQFRGYQLPTVRKLVRFTDIMFFKAANSPLLRDPAGFTAEFGVALPANPTIKNAVDGLKAQYVAGRKTNEANAEGEAIADMIDRGYIRFGWLPNPGENPNNVLINWEEEVVDATRFNFVDFSGDRAKAKKMFEESMQNYILNPTFENLMKWYREDFYSKRTKRMFPNFKMALKAHYEVMRRVKTTFNRQENISAPVMWANIQTAMESGMITIADAEDLKRDILGIGPRWLRIPGIGPVRYARMWADFSYYVGKQVYSPAGIAGNIFSALFQFFAEAFKQSAQQFGATR
ncbi:hypothetical protein A3F45_04335 [Candidatus Curtissbacteria bacterium RIFCSPHIGHO2_12_FULL_41_17]|uniref:Uncharacterized protein n=1 Tax=Candidatus Curtissbacteria bacterium RIFCSPHIGHO2_12_FULL_41_17 TaxID=1797722 RepID=A0A1F5HGI0_9BACT|nr:MAG: hypothetical protein A3F45_04335 [Candidatus Curtissbacteria bacterium RIFCSPHIGHO2_12_FULL_41_17]